MSWRQKAEFMREVGAIDATWDEKGRLLHLVLAPPATPGPAARLQAFHERTAKTDAERRKEAEERQQKRHDILFAASSVRPRLPDMKPMHAVPRAERAKMDAQRGKAQG